MRDYRMPYVFVAKKSPPQNELRGETIQEAKEDTPVQEENTNHIILKLSDGIGMGDSLA